VICLHRNCEVCLQQTEEGLLLGYYKFYDRKKIVEDVFVEVKPK